MGQRFLAVYAQAALHGPIARQGVDLVGRAHDNGIQVLLIEELAPIDIGLGLAVPSAGRGKVVLVDVAECGDVLAGDRVQVVATSTADADDPDIELLVGRAGCGMTETAYNPITGGNGGRGLEELATTERMAHGISSILRGGRWGRPRHHVTLAHRCFRVHGLGFEPFFRWQATILELERAEERTGMPLSLKL